MYKVDLFFNNGEILNYTSIPYKIADIWIENFLLPVTRPPYTLEPNVKESETHFSFPILDDRDKLVTELQNNIEQLSKAGYNIPYNISSGVTRQILNSLHEYFHTSVENQVKDNKDAAINRLVLNLNYNIHKLEPLFNLENSFNYSIVALKNNNIVNRLLSEEEKKYFTIDIHNEGVQLAKTSNLGYINYTTVGKNLLNCFCDDDIEIVKKGLIRNKTTGDNMLQFTYNQPKEHRIKNTSELNRNNVEGWLKKHNFNSREEILSDENLNQVYPPILEMTEECERRYTVEDIFRLYKYSSLSKVTTEKI